MELAERTLARRSIIFEERESEKAVAEAQKEMEDLAPATDEAANKRNQEKIQKIFEKIKKEMKNNLDK